jgi:MHS family proline/betaine transporter-like MFS transporter
MPDQRTPEPTADQIPGRLRDSRKALFAAGIGGFVEYFDFGSYGFLASTLARVFFPSHSPTVALLQTFGVFAVAFALRPLGGLVFGHFGDKVGRPRTMAATVIMMSIGTVGVGVLPGYATLGIGAPILLIVCRMLQGFSAGGEYNGAAVLLGEYAPAKRRGLLASAVPASGQLGLLISSLVSFVLAASLPAATFAAWGWRIPFLLALPFGLIGLYLRLRVEETPVFREVKTVAAVVRAPVLRSVRVHYREILTLFSFGVTASLGTYLMTVYTINYLTSKLKFSPTMALLASAIALVVVIAFNPISGAISDRVGRKPVLIVSLIGFAVLSVPSLFLISRGSLLSAILGLCLIAPLVSASTVIVAVVSVEIFPTKVRYTGGAISNNFAQILFAGTAPFVGTFLVAATGSPLAPGFYLGIVAVVSLIVVIFGLRETRTSSLVHDEDLQLEDRSPAQAGVITDAV